MGVMESGASGARGRSRRALLVAGVGLAGSAAAACGGLGGAGGSATGGDAAITAEPGTLQWMLWDAGPERLPYYEQIAGEFQAQQTAVKVDLIPPLAGSGSYFDKLKTQLAAGQPVDIIGASPVWVPDVATTGISKELNGFLSRDKGFKIEDYAKGVVDGASWKGRLHFLTLFGNFNLLYYNKALFDKAGVKYPDDTWTRDQVLDAARRITQRTGDPGTDVYGFNFARDLNNTLPWIWHNGGDAFDLPEDPTRATMSAAPTVDAVSWLADTINRHKVAPGEGGAAVPPFQSGRVGMMTQGVNSLGVVARDATFAWDVAVHPKGKAGRPNYAGTLYYGIANATKLPDASWSFVKHLCGVPGQRIFVQAQIGAPVHKDLEKDYEQIAPPPANRKAVTETLPNLKALPKTLKMMDIYAPVFGETLNQVWAGSVSATEGCRQIDDRVAAILKG